MNLQETNKIKSGFAINDDYLETLNQKIKQEVLATKRQKTIVKSLWLSLTAIAALLLVFFNLQNTNQQNLHEISAQQLMLNNTYYSDYFVAEELNDEDFEALAKSLEISEFLD